MGSGRVRVRASVALGGSAAARRARVRWSTELGERFLAMVRETGNARAAAAALGAPNAFNNRMKRDAGFRRRVLEAAAEADARLAGAEGAFPEAATCPCTCPPVGVAADPATGTRTCPLCAAAEPGTRTSTCPLPRPYLPPPAPIVPLATDAGALGGYLRPGRKRVSAAPQAVIRRNSQGRTQVTLAPAGHWTAEIEADFLARVRTSGNIAASARAVGFQPASVRERLRKWPAFKAAVDAAMEEASDALEYALVAHASALLGGAEGAERGHSYTSVPSDEAGTVRFDPIGAMRILGFIDARRARRIGRARKGPPEKTLDEAVTSILRKLDAIEKHKKKSERNEERGHSYTSVPSGEEKGE
jgi:hypothetical protein